MASMLTNLNLNSPCLKEEIEPRIYFVIQVMCPSL